MNRCCPKKITESRLINAHRKWLNSNLLTLFNPGLLVCVCDDIILQQLNLLNSNSEGFFYHILITFNTCVFHTSLAHIHRHVILPKELCKKLPRPCRLMTEEEWRSLGVTQSQGWCHYMLHTPEPHILLFRRPITDLEAARRAQSQFR